MRLEFSIEILRPRDEVFSLSSHLENDPKWQSAIQESNRLTLGPTRVGTRFCERIKLVGKLVDVDLEFHAFAPHERYVLGCSCGPLVFETEVRFASTRRGTGNLGAGSGSAHGVR